MIFKYSNISVHYIKKSGEITNYKYRNDGVCFIALKELCS